MVTEDIIRCRNLIVPSVSGANLGANAETGSLIVSGAKLWVRTSETENTWELVTSA